MTRRAAGAAAERARWYVGPSASVILSPDKGPQRRLYQTRRRAASVGRGRRGARRPRRARIAYQRADTRPPPTRVYPINAEADYERVS
ncbi:hypothetical protein EVAR_101171_1 [Eumeta japonica]|uniref:Uncharacterized protein n=1 Tax=Eumeta variegata TaxID=151549 RepID=A0A4C2AA77_EUMVA|nr:hypothetical protein EVAR_101171_1 [Eumeta japonica]